MRGAMAGALTAATLTACAPGEAFGPPQCPPRQPVTTTIKLARQFCETGERWESCLVRVHRKSDAEGSAELITVEGSP